MIDPDLSHSDIDELITTHSRMLTALRRLKGERVDKVQELCNLVGISKRSLAAGIVFKAKGQITITSLANQLNVERSTIYRWPEIVRALKSL